MAAKVVAYVTCVGGWNALADLLADHPGRFHYEARLFDIGELAAEAAELILWDRTRPFMNANGMFGVRRLGDGEVGFEEAVTVGAETEVVAAESNGAEHRGANYVLDDVRLAGRN